MELSEKLTILSMAARYDASCSSSGSSRNGGKGTTGNAAVSGICHAWSDDGRCVSLLKVLFSNMCVHDCAYCANRRSNDIPRAAFTPDELVTLTMDFYTRNYIEGLFLSSGVVRNADHTMEQLLLVVKKLRLEKKFRGYIHLKAIPGADYDLIRQAGLYVDRMSANVELPSEASLRLLAPGKDQAGILSSMDVIRDGIAENKDKRSRYGRYPLFTPAGQSTQLIIGATPESDNDILRLTGALYSQRRLKRVYYSAYIPVNNDQRLPALSSAPPLLREHRLYQADWLLRFYGFSVDEIVNENDPWLDTGFDPKTSWALRNLPFFPVDASSADYETLLRVPGIGVKSAMRIIETRKSSPLSFEVLKNIGVVLKRAAWFITIDGRSAVRIPDNADGFRKGLLLPGNPVKTGAKVEQLTLFD